MDATKIEVRPGYVWREGKIFEIGDYPDKQFSLNEHEADRAIEQFRPVDGDLEHKQTILSGKLGTMRRIWRDGKAVFGGAEVPEWLDAIFKQGEREPLMSCAWNRKAKTLDGWGWVLDPRIPEAALFSAYAEFARQEAAKAVSDASHTTVPQPQPNRGIIMPLLDKLREQFAAFNQGSASPTTSQADPTPQADPPATTGQSTEGEGKREEAQAAQGVIGFSAPGVPEKDEEAKAEFAARRIIAQASTAVDALIAEGRLLSAGRNLAMAVFTSAALRDEQGPDVVTFSKADGTVLDSSVAMLRELFREVPQHTYFSQQMPVSVLNGSRGTSAPDDRAKEEGERQAAEFNKQHPAYVASQNGKNGNGTH